MLRLIQEGFPWFLDTYLSYPRLVQRSDVMRYMALYKYGGVYLDADVSLLAAEPAVTSAHFLCRAPEHPHMAAVWIARAPVVPTGSRNAASS